MLPASSLEEKNGRSTECEQTEHAGFRHHGPADILQSCDIKGCEMLACAHGDRWVEGCLLNGRGPVHSAHRAFGEVPVVRLQWNVSTLTRNRIRSRELMAAVHDPHPRVCRADA